jgi:hypothetical protein
LTAFSAALSSRTTLEPGCRLSRRAGAHRSVKTTSENTRKTIEDKADGIIAKPFNTARVMSEIHRTLHQRFRS